jgi:hypothetical protein
MESRTTNSGTRAALYGLLALVIGVAIAFIKATLSH